MYCYNVWINKFYNSSSDTKEEHRQVGFPKFVSLILNLKLEKLTTHQYSILPLMYITLLVIFVFSLKTVCHSICDAKYTAVAHRHILKRRQKYPFNSSILKPYWWFAGIRRNISISMVSDSCNVT